jgi:hypothetical protein
MAIQPAKTLETISGTSPWEKIEEAHQIIAPNMVPFEFQQY